MAGRSLDPRFAERMRELIEARGLSYRALAARTFHAKSYLHDLATGRRPPTADAARRIDAALGAGGELTALVQDRATAPLDLDVADLAARVAASDVSPDTLERLDRAVDELAVAYATSAAVDLVPMIGQHLALAGQLLGARMTLRQQRQLVTAAGWLSLLAATVHIDLQTRGAPVAYLTAARDLAEHAEHPELVAWVLETRAWDALTNRRYRQAVDLSHRAQAIAPAGSSAMIQATAQEGRAWARMGYAAETRDALDRTMRLVSPLPIPERPEHHYRYDPDKALAYTATTLSWVGDPAAEDYARAVVEQLDSEAGRPRRATLARIDLSLALVVADKPDEAAAMATTAISAKMMVPSNWWRATEVVTAVERTGVPDARALRDAYETYRPGQRK